VTAASRALSVSSLRARLDDGSRRSRWLVNPDGVLGRVLELEAGAVYAVPLALGEPVSFHAQAQLYPHDWRDRGGALRVAVVIEQRDGRRRELWAQTLRAGDRGRPGGVGVDCRLPSDATALILECHPLRTPPANAVTRAIWVEPALDCLASPLEPAAVPASIGAVTDAGEEPLFSVVMPVHDPPLHMLRDAVESVLAQSFENWELCLVDDGSRATEIVAALDGYAQDARVHLHRHDVAQGISAATNAALQLATGRYIALLDHDDMLDSTALQVVADRVTAEPALDMIYSDEDIVDGGRPIWVHLKPGWSPDTLRTSGYTCHLGVYRRRLVAEIGGFRSAFDGSQDIDMILRLVERTDRIAHIPQILYHWRIHAASTAGGDAKPYAYVAARNAYAAHLERIGVPARVDFGPPGLYRVDAVVDPETPVTFVLGLASADGLQEAAASWVCQPHATWTVSLGAPAELHDELAGVLLSAGVDSDRITLTTGSLADAAVVATGEHLVIMQSPAAGLTHDWLTRLISYASQPGVAAAGPIVLAPDGRTAQAGIALPNGIPLHLLHGDRTSMDELFGYGTSVHNVSAVSGVLITPADTYRALGGLDLSHRELTLIAYCLRSGREGGRTVTIPDARLRFTGPDPAVNDLPALWRLQRDWAAAHDHDAYYNPGYRTDRGDFVRRNA
jgi:O-antigen biosynthesis protein